MEREAAARRWVDAVIDNLSPVDEERRSLVAVEDIPGALGLVLDAPAEFWDGVSGPCSMRRPSFGTE